MAIYKRSVQVLDLGSVLRRRGDLPRVTVNVR
jgi:hypothetical protein